VRRSHGLRVQHQVTCLYAEGLVPSVFLEPCHTLTGPLLWLEDVIYFRVLGTAAGGGLPQWNCACPNCAAARTGRLTPRLQASAAFSPDGSDWYLINATPDLTTQLARTPALHPQKVRETPIKGVILTDGELDHVLGLLHLREGAGWALYATDSTRDLLSSTFPALTVLNSYVAEASVTALEPGTPHIFGQGPSQVTLEILETGRELPRYAGAGERTGAVIALVLTAVSGKKLIYAPGVSELSPSLKETLTDADVILFDGTLYTDDELQTLKIGTATAADMGHVPMSGASGTAAFLADLPAPVKRYVHINNTNPALDETSPARGELRKLGLELAEDGWEVEL
jgi:pyrroloquinoline quinone biosynthesis protein B